jgi:hypothetical protein
VHNKTLVRFEQSGQRGENRFHRLFLLKLKQRFRRTIEQSGESQGEWQAGGVPPALDRVDALA